MQTSRIAFGLAFYLATISVVGLLAREASAQLINMSTRGFVGIGNNLLIGGFIIGGTAPKTVLIRGRGPSLGVGPFNVPGTLSDPFLRLFSGQMLIAENDNWETTQRNVILLTGLDPCQPNPGQLSAPVNCARESAILITLDPGAYTVHLGGKAVETGPFSPGEVTEETGVGLVEVFEVTPPVTSPITAFIDPPAISGMYLGSGSLTQATCQDPLNNGTVGVTTVINITSQSGGSFSGTGTISYVNRGIIFVTNFNLSGLVSVGGLLNGSFTFDSFANGFFNASGNGTFTGEDLGNTLSIHFLGQTLVGEICNISGSLLSMR